MGFTSESILSSLCIAPHMLHKSVSLNCDGSEDLPPDLGTAGLSGDNRLLILQHIVRVVKLSADSQERIKSQKQRECQVGN